MPDRDLVERAMDDHVVGDAWPRAIDEDHPEWNGDLRPVTPPDVASASKILRRLKSLDRDAAQVEDVVDAEIRRLRDFREDSLAGILREVEWGERALDAFMRQWSATSHKKTLALPDGKLTLRDPGAGKLIVENEEQVIAWARARDAVSSDPADPSVVNLRPVVSKAVIGQWYATSDEKIATEIDEETGEEVDVYAVVGPDGPIPGIVRHVAPKDTFKVTIGED
jgi:hypothetical protein